jgi:hypothetical protein
MDRPTKKIITPFHQIEVIIKEWMTGREEEYVQEPLIAAASVKMGVGQIPEASINTPAVTDSEHRLIETMVVSVAGKTEGVLNAVLDMHKDDKKFVLDAIDNQLKKK